MTVTPAADAVERRLAVAGMTCEHCVHAVTEELSAVPGVERVAVELRPGAVSTVTVTGSGPLDDQAISAAIEEAGYTEARA